jgi:hypothetical protein
MMLKRSDEGEVDSDECRLLADDGPGETGAGASGRDIGCFSKPDRSSHLRPSGPVKIGRPSKTLGLRPSFPFPQRLIKSKQS